jgi:putative membrane protein
MRKHFLAAVVVAVSLVGVGGAAGAGAESPPPLDTHWLKAAAQGDIFESTMGKLGLQKGSGDLCAVAVRLIADHTKSLQQTREVATRVKLTLPTRPNPFQQNAIKALATATGTSFQELFALFGVGAHQLAIVEAQEASTKAGLSQVRAFAGQELPVLRQHLTQLTKLAKDTAAAKAAQTRAGATPTEGGAANGAAAAAPTQPATQRCSRNYVPPPAPATP